MSDSNASLATSLANPLHQYYRFQSKIYDLTRWTFLFGRQRIIDQLPYDREATIRILEVGCGTGRNLVQLAKRFPNARIEGVDLSADMLAIARKKTAKSGGNIHITEGAFGQVELTEPFDVLLFSYCLTMVNPGWDNLIANAKKQLKPSGHIAVVDFHSSKFSFFQRHMAGHHVRMDGQLLPLLEQTFRTRQLQIGRAYGGVWEWVHYVGRAS